LPDGTIKEGMFENNIYRGVVEENKKKVSSIGSSRMQSNIGSELKSRVLVGRGSINSSVER
jgi:hypothetical protein